MITNRVEFGWAVRASLTRRFLSRMSSISLQQGVNENVTGPYSALLKYMWKGECRGACHSTSAALYIMLRELGNKPSLCIGEVRAAGPYFDHSWVELDGLVFDVAVSLPDLSENGQPVGGPVFASVDLYSTKNCELKFGIADGRGLDEKALIAYENTLADYARIQRVIYRDAPNESDIWNLSEKLLQSIGMSSTSENLADKYGSIRREYRRPTRHEIS